MTAAKHIQPINLLRGWPAASLLPIDLIRSAAEASLRDPAIALAGLCYGPDPGYQPLREALASWLTDFYAPTAGPVVASRLVITGGASQNLGCLLSVCTDPAYTRAAWLVAPAYFLAFAIFSDAGLGKEKMRAVREDDEGLDLEFLDREMAACEKEYDNDDNRPEGDRPRYKVGYSKVYRHVIYCVPSFANPSGQTLSRRRREELVRLARRYDALVICDDVYDFLQWRGGDEDITGAQVTDDMEKARIPRLVDVDRSLDGGAEREGADGFGNVTSNGSFSKLIGPGMRVGWCEGTAKFAHYISQTGTTRSGGAPSQLTSTYVTSLLTSGALQTHLRQTTRPGYARRYRCIRAAIATHLEPLGFSLPSTTTPRDKASSQSNRSTTTNTTTPITEDENDGEKSIVGGFFLWLTLPAGLGATDLTSRCQSEENLIVAPGTIFEVPLPEVEKEEGGGATQRKNAVEEENGLRFEENVRLCFTWEEEELLVEGVRRMGRVAGRMLEELRNGTYKFAHSDNKRAEVSATGEDPLANFR